ncbi:MAG: hypothetical protein CMJ90_08075 [Planctomycetes bacterium]|nr:hypothetical protein [Planctomycetota bacterium]
MTRFLAVMALGLPLLFTGCAQSELYDTSYDASTSAASSVGVAATGVVAPFALTYAGADLGTYAAHGVTFDAPLHSNAGLIGGIAGGAAGLGYSMGSWVEPYEKAAADLTLADVPAFAFGLTDPYQVLPPPFGTAYAPWKLFVTAVRALPFLSHSEDGEAASFTMTSGSTPGPLWYVVGPALEDLDSFVQPIRTTVTASHSPVPGDGTRNGYLMARWNHQWRNFKHSGNTLKYWLFSTNSNLPPYDNFFPDQTSRDKTTILQTIDTFLFGFDWDDPYLR